MATMLKDRAARERNAQKEERQVQYWLSRVEKDHRPRLFSWATNSMANKVGAAGVMCHRKSKKTTSIVVYCHSKVNWLRYCFFR